MRRMWINQPSTKQTHHSLHGTRVLVDTNRSLGDPVTVYFLSGAVVSMRMSPMALSDGWYNGKSTDSTWEERLADSTSYLVKPIKGMVS